MGIGWGQSEISLSLYGGVPNSLSVLSATAPSNTQVLVSFTANVDPSDSQTLNSANFTIPGLVVLSVNFTVDLSTLVLTTTPQSYTIYTVTVSSLKSQLGQALQAPFVADFSGNLSSNLSTFIPKGLSKTKILIIFGSPLDVSSAPSTPSNYVLESVSGALITVSSATVNSFSDSSSRGVVTLELASSMLDGYYSLAISNVTLSGSLSLTPNIQLFQWATPSKSLVVPISRFSGEVRGGLYGIPDGMVFFSPSLLGPAPNSTIQVEEVDVCTTASDTYAIPTVPYETSIFTTYSPSIPNEAVLGGGFVLFSGFENLTQAKLDLTNNLADSGPILGDTHTHLVPANAFWPRDQNPAPSPYPPTSPTDLSVSAIVTLTEAYDPTQVSLLNDPYWLLDPLYVVSHPFITANNIAGPIPPGPTTTIYLEP